jgi:hypothetical protein
VIPSVCDVEQCHHRVPIGSSLSTNGNDAWHTALSQHIHIRRDCLSHDEATNCYDRPSETYSTMGKLALLRLTNHKSERQVDVQSRSGHRC